MIQREKKNSSDEYFRELYGESEFKKSFDN
jgi:hypothetical protein